LRFSAYLGDLCVNVCFLRRGPPRYAEGRREQLKVNLFNVDSA
jgi:hypothetical protein